MGVILVTGSIGVVTGAVISGVLLNYYYKRKLRPLWVKKTDELNLELSHSVPRSELDSVKSAALEKSAEQEEKYKTLISELESNKKLSDDNFAQLRQEHESKISSLEEKIRTSSEELESKKSVLKNNVSELLEILSSMHRWMMR